MSLSWSLHVTMGSDDYLGSASGFCTGVGGSHPICLGHDGKDVYDARLAVYGTCAHVAQPRDLLSLYLAGGRTSDDSPTMCGHVADPGYRVHACI